MFGSPSSRAASAYQRINVETSMHTIDQHQLVSLLFKGIIEAIATARGALQRGDVALKCNSISKAIRIIEEGLSTALDRENGGEIAENLGALYDYSVRRLITANTKNDDAILLEVQRLIEPLEQSWSAMRQGNAPATPAATAPYQPAAPSRSTLLEA